MFKKRITTNSFTHYTFVIICLIIIFSPTYVKSENLLRAPKSSAQIVREEAIKDNENSLIIRVFSAPVVFYQKFLSPYWGYKCSQQPSCSQYSRIAIKKHGAIIGIVMTFDRLQHEANEARFSPLIEIDGKTKVYDTVENNDFWWFGK